MSFHSGPIILADNVLIVYVNESLVRYITVDKSFAVSVCLLFLLNQLSVVASSLKIYAFMLFTHHNGHDDTVLWTQNDWIFFINNIDWEQIKPPNIL